MEELTVDLRDLNGYQVTSEDLAFLHLDPEGVLDMIAKARPLGVTDANFSIFVRSLADALAQDGLGECDVRLQGSAAFFFSGGQKQFPLGPDYLAQAYREVKGKHPDSPRIANDAYGKLRAHWPNPRRQPLRRIFDLLQKLSLLEEASDLDVQISSHAAFEAVKSTMVRDYGSDRGIRYRNPNYNFIDPALWHNVLLALSDWQGAMTHLIKREVNVALFSGDGPPRSEELWSSHFQNGTDWIINLKSGRR